MASRPPPRVPHPADLSQSSEPLEQVLTPIARALVDAQLALDAHARQRLRRWEDEGLPPSAFGFSEHRLRALVAFACTPKDGPRGRTLLKLRLASTSTAAIRFTVRHLPAPLGGDEEP